MATALWLSTGCALVGYDLATPDGGDELSTGAVHGRTATGADADASLGVGARPGDGDGDGDLNASGGDGDGNGDGDGDASSDDGDSDVTVPYGCDALDEGDATGWYRDADGDGYGDPASTMQACVQPSGYVADSSDCDDDPLDCGGACAPGLVEAPGNCGDGHDNDCDGEFDGADADCHWWDRSYLYRHKLTLDNDDPGNELLTGFPLLVSLSDENVQTDMLAAAAADLRFVDADDQTVLPFEVEVFDTAATSQIWVRVPTIDADSATDHIYLYYGNPTASALPADTRTWDASYQAVFHMHGSADDSSANAFDGAVNGPSTTTSGRIGSAYSFGGATDHIDLGTLRPWLRSVSGWSLEAWVRPTSINTSTQSADGNWVVSLSVYDTTPSVNSRAAFGLQDTDELGMLSRAGDRETRATFQTNTGPIELDRWHHIVATMKYGSGAMRLYVDGELLNAGNANFNANSTSDTDSRSATIGAEDDASGEFFLGLIDEVRISTVSRTDAWIGAQYRSMTGTMVDYGPAESWP